MPLTSISLGGGEYRHRSRPLSAQRTRNFWPQIQTNQKEFSNYILQSFYGLKTFATFADGPDRGMLENQGVFYRVAGTNLYSVSSTGVHTLLGEVPGSGRCIMEALDSAVTIVTGGNAYQYDGSTVTKITDPNMAHPNGCASINNQMVYDEGSGQTFWVSDSGDATTLNGLNNAAAESAPDALIRPYSFRQTLYLMGAETIELWWNSGQGNPPFDRIQGGIINLGLGALYSMAENPDFLFFLGADRKVYTLTGGSSAVDTEISTPAMAYEFQNYTSIDDAIGFTMELEGQWFYVLTFPIEDKTWVYPIGGEWFEWGSSLTGRIRANSYAFVFGKHLVGDFASGNIYELDSKTYTDGGETISRIRDGAPIHGGLLQVPGKKIEMSRFELLLETGTGIDFGQGVNPEVMISFSDDGGRTFGTELRGRVGTQGAFGQKVEWFGLGSFYERVIRIRVSDPVYWSIYSAAADLELCI